MLRWASGILQSNEREQTTNMQNNIDNLHIKLSKRSQTQKLYDYLYIHIKNQQH